MGKLLKRTCAGVLMAAAVLAVGTTSVFAAGPGAGKNFTDANGDGICDCRETVCRYADANEDGICDSCGRNQKDCPSQNGCGKYFVDADHDGVCDRAENRDCPCGYAAGRGLGQGKGFRGGRGR